MPILPPSLDDRGFDDLVSEALARIPAHTPEWTDAQPGDPGRTLIELFAWLTDSLLYRANLIPERQRLAFLRLLGEPMRPAAAARGLVTVRLDEESAADVALAPLARIAGPPDFETLSELTVLPVTGEAFIKRPLSERETREMSGLLAGLREVYNLPRGGVGYVTTPVFPEGAAVPAGLDLVGGTVDRCLWIALLAPKPELVEGVRATLGGAGGVPRLLSVGIAPALRVPELSEQIGLRARVRHVWEVSTGRTVRGEPEYLPLDVITDSAAGLSRRGVVRLALPGSDDLGAPENDVRRDFQAGVGRNRPPRLDDPARASRLVAWLRLRPTEAVSRLALTWVGINAVEIDQRQSLAGVVIGTSDGGSGQVLALPARSVEPETFALQVEEPDLGYVLWSRIGDLGIAGADDAVYELDSEAGTVRFGDGLRGRVPAPGMRVRVAALRGGGGRAGNLPPGSLKGISARTVSGETVTRKLAVAQPLPAEGGTDAETLEDAERRIPALFRHRDRAVTEEDFRRLAAETPGVSLGRVELLPRFKPQQRRTDVPGVVSVMVLPSQPLRRPPNPRADRPLIEAVHAWLDARRPLTCELYVIGCEYVPLALTVGVEIRDGFGHDQVLQEVREALRAHLWPLAPGGPGGTGWPLGRTVEERELEVVVARVAGVQEVLGVFLFARETVSGELRWRRIQALRDGAQASLRLDLWQLPELLAVVVAEGEVPLMPTGPGGLGDGSGSGSGGGTGSGGGSGSGGGTGSGGTGSGGTGSGGSGSGGGTGSGGGDEIPIPVVPEVC